MEPWTWNNTQRTAFIDALVWTVYSKRCVADNHSFNSNSVSSQVKYREVLKCSKRSCAVIQTLIAIVKSIFFLSHNDVDFMSSISIETQLFCSSYTKSVTFWLMFFVGCHAYQLCLSTATVCCIANINIYIYTNARQTTTYSHKEKLNSFWKLSHYKMHTLHFKDVVVFSMPFFLSRFLCVFPCLDHHLL